MVAKKMGRPTENKKDFMLRVRLDSDYISKLEYLEKKFNLTKSEIVRTAVDDLYKKEK